MSLKFSILALLQNSPKTGYELANDIDQSVGFFWTATHQQIYKELSGLEKLDWVKHSEITQKGKPNKKLYQITRTGLEELKTWIQEPTESSPNRDALLVKLFSGHLVPSDSTVNELKRLKEDHVRMLNRYRQIEKEHFSNIKKLSREHLFQYFTLRRGILYERTWIRWANETLSTLEKLNYDAK
jgi:DNA-binding PadR family transcriptional regulator